MLDETTPTAEESAATPAQADEASAAKPAKKAATPAQADEASAAKPAKKAAARKTAAKKTAATKTAARTTTKAAAKRTTKKAAAAPDAEQTDQVAEPVVGAADEAPAEPPVKKAAAKRTRKAPAKKAAATEPVSESPAEPVAPADAAQPAEEAAPAKKAAAKKTAAKKTAAKKTASRTTKKAAAAKTAVSQEPAADATRAEDTEPAVADSGTLPLFQAPEPVKKAAAKRTRKRAVKAVEAPVDEAPAPEAEDETAEVAAEETTDVAAAEVAAEVAEDTEVAEDATAADETAEDETSEDETSEDEESEEGEGNAPARRRRRRGGRRRRKSSDATGESGDADVAEATGGEETPAADSDAAEGAEAEGSDAEGDAAGDSEQGSSSSRRRRRRRRSGDSDAAPSDDPENTVTRVRSSRSAEDQITAVSGSTRLEAKKQRRREGREAGRRRAPIVSEAEFLARREAVERVMVIRQRKDLTQIAVLEDKVLVEHYVARESQTSLIGNVYLGRVQNVLPSMEAAFIDIGKGRNAVLYAGEVNWSALGHKDGQPRKIESVLSPGQPVLVQVTKDPVGHKGARLTSQVSLAGRFLVYVPDGTTSGISRKLPDTERSRLKTLLKEIVPDSAGVIVRTAAEGASEEELTRDVERLKARWEVIESKAKGNAPQLLYGEPDLTLKVVRDLFTEDFVKLVIEGDDAWDTVSAYVEHVAPDLADRVEKYVPGDVVSAHQGDVFSTYRIDEQIAKGLDRKVWLPSGGSLVIDRTEAMTVVDVNTGKFTGSGGNLEETVTKNNLEAAEEIVRQLRLRDIGGIIVVDFIDMVLESNRDLVVRRLVECLGRDRTRHQVAEVTSLGLVQMTRKRIGTGLLEAFSTDCEHCQGRGLVTHAHPVDQKSGGGDDEGRRGRRRGRGRDAEKSDQGSGSGSGSGYGSGGGREGAKESGGRSQRGGRPEQAEAPATPAVPPGPPSPKDVAAMARHEAPPAAEPEAAQEPAAEPAVAPEAPQPVAEPVAEPVAPPVAEPEIQSTESAEPTETTDGTPRVVTRQRRGASRRTAITTSAPAVVVTEPSATPIAAPAAVADTEESRPKVVTRTRGRAAARPAGPPAEDGAAGEDSGVEHVPVKKKGSRKR